MVDAITTPANANQRFNGARIWGAFNITGLDYVWDGLARYADAITDTVGQPLFIVGRYSGQNVAALSLYPQITQID